MTVIRKSSPRYTARVTRPRVCAAILRNNEILMVRHQHDGRAYWTLPGGGVELGETNEQAVLREVREETHLEGSVQRYLFAEPYPAGLCLCFLVAVDAAQTPHLGYDPEETHLPAADRMLRDLAWQPLRTMQVDSQVSRVIAVLGLDASPP